MLVLTRKIGESIHIGDDVVVTVQDVRGGRIRISVQAPSDVLILRGELVGQRPGPEEWADPIAAPRIYAAGCGAESSGEAAM